MRKISIYAMLFICAITIVVGVRIGWFETDKNDQRDVIPVKKEKTDTIDLGSGNVKFKLLGLTFGSNSKVPIHITLNGISPTQYDFTKLVVKFVRPDGSVERSNNYLLATLNSEQEIHISDSSYSETPLVVPEHSHLPLGDFRIRIALYYTNGNDNGVVSTSFESAVAGHTEPVSR